MNKIFSQRVSITFGVVAATVLSIDSWGCWCRTGLTLLTVSNASLALVFWGFIRSACRQMSEIKRFNLLEEEVARKYKLLKYETKDINPSFAPYTFDDLENFATNAISKTQLLEIILNNIDEKTHISKLPCHDCKNYTPQEMIRCTVKPNGSAINCKRHEPISEELQTIA
jgi:hypothetical protein